MKYKVKLEATVTATVWVKCSDLTEAQSIAENAWKPVITSDGGYAGIDPSVEAVYDWNVDLHSENTRSVDVEQV